MKRVAEGVRRRMMSPHGRLAVANAATSLVGLVTGVATARILGPAQRGELAIITFWPALLAALADLSIADTVTIRGARDRSALNGAARDGYRVALVCALAGVSFGVLAMPRLLTADQQHLIPSATAYLVFIPVALIATPVTGVLLGRLEYGRLVLIRVLSAVAYLLSVIVLTLLHSASARTVAAASLVAPATVAVAGALFARSGRREEEPVVESAVLDQLRIGASLHPSRVAALLSAMADRAIANRTLGRTDVGLYQIPVAVRMVAASVAQAVAQGLMPELARATAGEREPLVRRAVARAIIWTGLIAVVGVLLAPAAIPLVFGRSFAAAVPATALILVGAVVESGVTVLQVSARTLLLVRLPVASELVALTASLTLGPALATRFGTVGLAAAFCISRVTALSVLLWGLRRRIGLRLRDVVASLAQYFRQWSRQLRLARPKR